MLHELKQYRYVHNRFNIKNLFRGRILKRNSAIKNINKINKSSMKISLGLIKTKDNIKCVLRFL